MATLRNLPIQDRSLRIAALGGLALYGIAALSYLHTAAASFLGIVIIVLVGWADSTAIFLLALALLPYAKLFALDTHQLTLWFLAALAIAVLRGLPTLRTTSLRTPVLLLFSAFTVLVVTHFKTFALLEMKGLGFLVAIGVLMVTVQHMVASETVFINAWPRFFTVSVAAAAALSALFEFGALTALIQHHHTVDQLRLQGVFEGVNTAAHYMVVAFAALLFIALSQPKLSPLQVAGLVLLAVCVVLTKTKAAIACVVLACVLAAVLVPTSQRKNALSLLGIVVCSVVVWVIALQPQVNRYAATAWHTAGNNLFVAEMADVDLWSQLKEDLRIGDSRLVTLAPDGEMELQPRPYSLWHTGLRDVLWRAGLEIWRDHFWWGIGYKKWPEKLQAKVGYPNRSPHNGFLEVAGAYGVLGAALYLILIVLVLRNLSRTWRLPAAAKSPALLTYTVVPTLWLGWELVDASTSLAVTLAALWFWVMLAMQEALLRRAALEQVDSANRPANY